MINIRIICIGRLKENYWREAVEEYEKRLAPYCRLEIVELKEARLPANASPADEEGVRESEGKALLAEVAAGAGVGKGSAPDRAGGPADYVFAMDPRGRQYSSPEFARHLGALAASGKSRISFLIGGSLGLSEAVRSGASELMSFSKLTFPHQMFRPVLLEQIYRAFKINAGEKYHK